MKFKSRKEEVLFKKNESEQKEKRAAEYAALCDMARKNKTPYLHRDHKMPTNRRELLSCGLISSVGVVALPNLLGLASGKAFGEEVECSKGSKDAKFPGYVEVHLSGGWSPGHNVFPTQSKDGGFDPLSDDAYQAVGLGTAQNPKAVQPIDMGAMLHPNTGFYRGLASMASPSTLAKVRIAFMANESADDNGNNPLNATDLAALVHGGGDLTQSIESGIRHRPAFVDASLAKVAVENESSLSSLVDPGLIAQRLSNGSEASGRSNAVKTAQLTYGFSKNKLDAMSERLISAQNKSLVACGYKGASELLVEFTADRITPSSDGIITGTPFQSGVSYAEIMANNDLDSLQKSIVIGKVLSDGLAATATLAIGGYDYHGRGLPNQDNKDMEAGQAVGAMLEIAARKGSPLFIAVTSDGSVSYNGRGDQRSAPSADSGVRGAALMIAIGADEAPVMKKHYIGRFNDAGAVDSTYLVTSARGPAAAMGIAYNYAAFAGRMAEYQKLTAGNPITEQFNEDDYLAFAPMS